MQSHDHYEQLCAAAVSGQIRPDELSELKEHMNTCADCREFVGDIGAIVGQKIPELAQRSAVPSQKPAGMTDRFIARAHSEGIPLRKNKQSGIKRPKQAGLALFAAGAIAAILTVAVSLKIFKAGPIPSRSEVSDRAAQMRASPANGNDAIKDTLSRENGELRQRLQDAQAQLDSLTAKLKFEHDALKLAAVQNSKLSSHLPAVEDANAGLRKSLADRELQLAQIKEDLVKVESEQEAGRIASQVEEAELNTLRNKVVKLTTELQESEQLSGAAKQAKDLIVARNLHIVDVHDADESGKRQRAFGRIFYTEGKSLVFYAYDLADPRQLDAKIDFYVWGGKDGSRQSVRSLGIFHRDDENEGRWVVRFDDAGVLARIDSVFVTVESKKKAASQPSGKRILYAFLGNNPNHP